MKDQTYPEKEEFLQLCRDINAGLFSEDVISDIKSIHILFNKCANRKNPKVISHKSADAQNRAEKRELLKTVYICLINLSNLDLNEEEKLATANEIVKQGGFAYLTANYGAKMDAVDLVRLAKLILSEEYKDEENKKERLRLLSLCRNLSFFKIIFGKIS